MLLWNRTVFFHGKRSYMMTRREAMRRLVGLELVALSLIFWIASDVTALTIHRPAYLAGMDIRGETLFVGPTKWCGRDYRGNIVVVQNRDLCPDASNTTNTTQWRGAVILSPKGDCAVTVKAVAAQKKGAVGLIVEVPVGVLDVGSDVTIPVESVESEARNLIVETISQGMEVDVSLGISLNVLRFAA
ncbi:hypothetical protein DQ04_05471030 [Trypanosoma grayi]|uniref:hypothetical protein n=1 Tax=Trypanosoma grayi TaxID=71804 RepID=UPI0004F4B4B8|nr:hypothetical protein DQ04_05471030 [Trypanosoma grayi]KEG09289.1 hypothetical protein DQ04_05471030 [Trypanosoma grayi]